VPWGFGRDAGRWRAVRGGPEWGLRGVRSPARGMRWHPVPTRNCRSRRSSRRRRGAKKERKPEECAILKFIR